MLVQKDGFCALCWSQCGVTYGIDEDRVVSVTPLPGHPNGGATCPKGRAAAEILENPERMLYPLRRTRPKTDEDPGWERISWDEALDEVAGRLAAVRSESGAEAVAFATATNGATGLNDGIEWIDHLIRNFGSPNKINAVELCDFPKTSVHPLTFGTSIPYPEYQDSDTIVLWGFNPSSTWLNGSGQIAAAREKGARIIVVDPRRAGFGLEADHWLRIRPGSDGALALGLANLMIQGGTLDEAFIRRWSSATLLVRSDNGRFLRGADLGDGFERGAYIAWSSTANGPVPYDEKTRMFAGSAAELALRGVFEVPAEAGPVTCRPAFALYEELCAQYPLERVAALTWLRAEDIRAVASALGASRRFSYYVWTGVSQHAQAGQTDRAIALLMSLKGSFDAPGGNVVPEPVPRGPIGNLHILPDEQIAKTVGLAELPFGPPAFGVVTGNHFRRAVLQQVPYKIRALVGFGANLTLAHAAGKEMRAALQALDFYVHCDLFENPTSRFADIFLPVNTHLEREALRIGFQGQPDAEEHVQLRQQMVTSRGEARSDVEICFELGVRLGHGEAFFGGSIQEGYRAFLAPTGVTLDQLQREPNGIRVAVPRSYRKYLQPTQEGYRGFATETGLVEIYSERLLRSGQPALPVIDVGLFPGDDPEFPLALTSAKSGYFCHSQHRSIPSLRLREMDPTVEMSPDTADEIGLMDGDWAFVETKQGRVRMRLRTNADLHPRVVRGSYGWWQGNQTLGLPALDPFSDAGSNYNLLVDPEQADPITGVPAHRSTSCRITPVEPKAEWNGFRPFRVGEIERVAEDVLTLTFHPYRGEALPDYRPGQHVSLRWQGASGDALIRSYSLIGPATEIGRKSYRVSVRHCAAPPDRPGAPHGAMSTELHERLRPGDRIELRPPAGRFVLPLESAHPIVLVAGGIGITPFLSYLETLAAEGAAPRVHLVSVNRTLGSHAFRARIADLAPCIPGFTALDLYTREIAGAAPVRRPTVDDIWLDEFERPPFVFLCGPNAMMRELRSALLARGLPPGSVLQEAFAADEDDTSEIPEGPFQVTFAKSRRTSTWRRQDGSVLNLAEAAGLELASGCRVGQCESCLAPILSGSAIHRVRITRPDDGCCLLCQAVPTSDLVLDA